MDGNMTGSRYCGYEPVTYESISRVIYLHFHSDVTGQDAGFRLILQVQTPGECLHESSHTIMLLLKLK